MDNGYGIYELATGKPLMFVPRDELLAAPNPGAYFQAILDQIAATFAPSLRSVVEVPENLAITEDAARLQYVVRRMANGEALKVVPWDSLPSDRSAAAECVQEIVNETAAELKHHQQGMPQMSSASARGYVGAVIWTAVCVAGSAAVGWLIGDDPRPAILVGVFLSVGLFWYPRRRSS